MISCPPYPPIATPHTPHNSGIDVVRNKIKLFAQKRVTLPKGQHKIVILDEADSMTKGAQQALRRTMELYTNTTRFALACNISSKVIEAIQSRCAILRFTRLSDQQVLKRCLQVLEAEKITKYDNSGMEAVLFSAQGDMRNALNNMQSTYAGTDSITSENVFKVVDQPHPIAIQNILMTAAQGKLTKAIKGMKVLYHQGYASTDIVRTTFRVAKTLELPDNMKMGFIREIGFTHMRVADGVNSLLQLTAMIARLTYVAAGKKPTGH
jgi:replication factor C subunit 2/4